MAIRLSKRLRRRLLAQRQILLLCCRRTVVGGSSTACGPLNPALWFWHHFYVLQLPQQRMNNMTCSLPGCKRSCQQHADRSCMLSGFAVLLLSALLAWCVAYDGAQKYELFTALMGPYLCMGQLMLCGILWSGQ